MICGETSRYTTVPKWIKSEHYIMGIEGDPVVELIVRGSCRLQSMDITYEDIIEYAITLSNALKGYTFSILIGGNGNLYRITNEFKVVEIDQFDCIGEGSEVALGSLYSTDGLIQLRIETAVRAASVYCPHVGGQVFKGKI
jgi:hypothetical protein